MRINNFRPDSGIQALSSEHAQKNNPGEQLRAVSSISSKRSSRYIASSSPQEFQSTTTYSRRKKVNAPHADELRKNIKIIQNTYRNWKEQNSKASDLSAQRFVDLHPQVKGYLAGFYAGPVEAILHPFL